MELEVEEATAHNTSSWPGELLKRLLPLLLLSEMMMVDYGAFIND